MSKSIKIKNTYKILKPVNAVAEFCFGNICDEHMQEIIDNNPGYDYESIYNYFKRAIELGLSYEMSTSDDPTLTIQREAIWKIMEKEARGKHKCKHA